MSDASELLRRSDRTVRSCCSNRLFEEHVHCDSALLHCCTSFYFATCMDMHGFTLVENTGNYRKFDRNHRFSCLRSHWALAWHSQASVMAVSSLKNTVSAASEASKTPIITSYSLKIVISAASEATGRSPWHSQASVMDVSWFKITVSAASKGGLWSLLALEITGNYRISAAPRRCSCL